MPSFQWKGRAPSGAEIKGEMTARSKEEVITRLRQQQIVVSHIVEASSGGAVDFRPPEPDHLADPSALHLPGRRAATKPSRLTGLLIIAGFVAAAFGVGLLGPIAIWTCERSGDGRVGCSISESDLGVVPLRLQTLGNVSAVDVETKVLTGAIRSLNGTRTESRLVLRNGDGRSIQSMGADQTRPSEWRARDASIAAIRLEFQSFLEDPAQARISTWGGHSVPLILSGVLLLLAGLMLLMFVLSLFSGPREWVQAQAELQRARIKSRR